ncbi:MAG: sugar transferase [Bacteroidales bacterium]|nr:sugar transferase [Bacteroidales bacterium]
MENYLQYVHNLKGDSRFEKFGQSIQSAITFHYVRQIEDNTALQKALLNESCSDVLNFISEHLDLQKYYKSIIFTTDNSSYIEDVDFNNIRAIINFRKVNHIKHMNSLFKAVNTMLPDAGIYICRLETYKERKEFFYRKYGSFAGQILWLVDFVFNRVIPRIPYLERLYYFVTNGQFHTISGSEVMGRLVYCGFNIVDLRSINGLAYIVAIKTGHPLKHQHPSFYPIIRLSRVGKDGTMIGVYKFRTMHPYSEYLQDYIIRLNGYNNKGKPADDYRITRWGKWMRKLWIDELPQIFNLLKGEMKLVGLRPLSQVRYNEFPEDLQRERIKYKPGCFPPYVALNMPDDKKNIEAERIYINDFRNHPFTTDIRYLFQAVYNIFTNKIRSS